MIGWDDTPHLQPPIVSKEELDDLYNRLRPHERKARRTGQPGLGAGAVYPVDMERLLIEPFKIPDHWQRGWALDVGWNRTAALFGAKDPDADAWYLTHEYYQGEAKPIEHAFGVKAMLPWPELEGAIDPAARNRNQKDGTRLMDEYEDLGLRLRKANNAVEAGIHHCLLLMQASQLKVFNTLVYWRKEAALYRRKEKSKNSDSQAGNGKIVKENDHLMDCMRYLLNTDDIFKTRPQQVGLDSIMGGEW